MKKIWIVYEDDRGDLSYWDNKKKAYEEARNIIMTYPYHYETEEKITREDITDKDIDDYKYCVRVYSETIGKSWV